MSGHALTERFRRIGAHRDNLYVELVELRPKLFPSLEFSDAVGSPVAAEKFQQDWSAIQGAAVKGVSLVIGRAEVQQRFAQL